ncbi:Tautomerase/MIF superfamily [Dactylonectria macrodidyma]|uniref:L-dopachrome isomerase n=1 Tax=Dactylonectria macrodidyma TaxID=307937 RepID=A0A9P9ETB3_9HYPO|nr:Tautomerase/MIF superfamily [Dactylonectria macrodidyma]
MGDSPVSRMPLPGAPGTSVMAEADSSPPAAPPKLALPEQRGKSRMNKPSLEPVMEISQKTLGDIRPPLPGDVTRVIRKQSHPELRKQRSLYFEDAFASKEKDLLGDMVRSEAIVVAEVKTNVLVHDEYTFVQELSQHLAVRYHRQMSSIVVTLRHSACIFFGGSCDPAYTMTVEALSSLVQPATNKRNVALLQQHMEQALGVPASRGYVRFVAMTEECSGWQGKTVAGKIAEVGGQTQAGTEKLSRKPKMPRHGSRNDKSTSPRKKHSNSDDPEPHVDTLLRESQPVDGSGSDTGSKKIQSEANVPKTLKRRKSFIQTLLARTSTLAQGIQGARARRGS